jgi:enterochelin esterase-like enzyme
LRLPLEYRIYTPPCYDQLSQGGFPVLYLFHGQGYTDDQWERLGVEEVGDRLMAAGEIPQFLVVMPHDRYLTQPTENNYAKAIIEVLVPYVNTHYHTLPDRKYRAIGGLSRGAGWAVHLGISQWEFFGALGAHSPAIFRTDAPQMRTWLSEIPAEYYPRIYIDVGDNDRTEILESAIWFEKLLNEKDIPHEWHLFSGYHNEAYWHSHIEKYLRWYAAGW